MLACMEERKLVCKEVGTQVRTQAYMVVVGTQEHILVLVVGTRAHTQVCMLEGTLERILALAVGTQVHILALVGSKQVEGRQVCKLVAGRQVLVHTLLGTMAVGHNIQMSCPSHDCQSIPPIGVLSCIEEATRHLFLVVFSL